MARIGLVAHDDKKDELVAWARAALGAARRVAAKRVKTGPAGKASP